MSFFTMPVAESKREIEKKRDRIFERKTLDIPGRSIAMPANT